MAWSGRANKQPPRGDWYRHELAQYPEFVVTHWCLVRFYTDQNFGNWEEALKGVPTCSGKLAVGVQRNWMLD
jgi:hypothetical protein